MAMVDSGIMTDPVKKDAAALEIPGAGPVRPAMVDSSTMTEPLETYLDSPAASAASERPRTMESVIAPAGAYFGHDESPSRPLSTYSDASAQHDPDMTRSLAQFPVPPTMQRAIEVPAPAPVLNYAALDQLIIDPVEEPEVVPVPPTLSFVTVDSQQIEPISEPEVPPPPPIVLGLSSVLSEDVEPLAEPEVIPPVPVLAFSSVVSELIEPIAEPVITPEPLVLGLSPLLSESLEPKAEPSIEPPSLSLSTVVSEAVEPIAEPAIELPAPPAPPNLSMSTVLSEAVEPVAEPEVLPAVVPAPALVFAPLVSEEVEPLAEPEAPLVLPPTLSISPLWEHNIEPFAEPAVQPVAPILGFSSLLSEGVEPVADPVIEPIIPTLGFSGLLSEGVEPLAEPIVEPVVPTLAFSPLLSEGVEPLAEPVIEPEVVTLGFSTVLSEGVEPIQPEAPAPIALTLSTIHSEGVEPVAEPEPVPAMLGFSHINSWDVEPRADPAPLPPALSLSSIAHEEVKPIAPPTPPTVAPTRFAFSSIDSVETRPITPRSPWRDGFILPRDADIPIIESSPPRTPDHTLFGAIGRNKSSRGRAPIEPVIAEDETRQSPSGARHPDTPESQRPFKEISTNMDSRPARKPSVSMADQGAQTSLTADAIDQMLMAKARSHEKNMSIDSSVGTPGTVRIRRLSHGQESPAFSREASVDLQNDSILSQRPGSAASSAAPTQPLPPLPPNHKEKIEAARTGSSHGTQAPGTVMGPPLWPASAMRNQRPRTPSIVRPQSPASIKISTPTPRAARTSSITPGTAIIHSPTKASARSRRSSISSFASEVDMRFGNRNMGFETAGFGPNTDPRMIQAITQTMIGEYLWKYTRKAGRGDMSENRHRRYFWVHPYTRTLYWSDRDPSAAGRSALKAKSVPIEAVRVVTDDNPMPPGLHRKSLIVISPGRAVKFTCTTGQRHETWFNALSYLLLRTNDEGQNDAEEMVGNLTQADVDEFNPQVGRERVTAGNRPVAPQSLSSYNSRTTRNSPALDMSMEFPTLTPTPGKSGAPQRPSIGTLGRLSGYWKNSQVLSGTFSSFRGRTTSNQAGNSIYEASEVHDSAEDVREMIERQDREADRLENVRACCDGKCSTEEVPRGLVPVLTRSQGKHDVGSLHHHSVSKRQRPSLGRSIAGSSTTPMSTMKSRA
jgi:meiotic cell cortex pleckstrin-like protein